MDFAPELGYPFRPDYDRIGMPAFFGDFRCRDDHLFHLRNLSPNAAGTMPVCGTKNTRAIAKNHKNASSFFSPSSPRECGYFSVGRALACGCFYPGPSRFVLENQWPYPVFVPLIAGQHRLLPVSVIRRLLLASPGDFCFRVTIDHHGRARRPDYLSVRQGRWLMA